MNRRKKLMAANVGSALSSLLTTGLTYFAPLTTSTLLGKGFGAPTYTRATTATVEDFEGLIKPVLSGEVRFQGARRVRNIVQGNSNDFTVASWTKTNITVTGTQVINFDGTLNARLLQVLATVGNTYAGSIRVRRVSGTVSNVRFFQLSGCPALPITDAWQILSFTGAATGASIGLYDATGQVGSIELSYIQFENVTGQSNQNPSEYVSVGAAKLNELIYTSEFDNAAWAKANITVTANAIAAPDGTLTADKVEATAAAVTTLVQIVTGVGRTTGNTAFIYAKQGSGATQANTFIFRDTTAATNLVYLTINYGTGALTDTTGSGPATATDVGDGWWKIPFSGNAVTNGNSIGLYPAFVSLSEGAGEFAYLWGAQLEKGTAAGDYYPVANVYPYHGAMVDGVKYFSTTNGNTVSSNVVTEASGSPISLATLKGYLAEGARTNLLLWSTDPMNVAWNALTGVTAAATTGFYTPTSGVRVTETATTNIHVYGQSRNVVNGSVYTASVYAKAGTRTWVMLYEDSGAGVYALFDLANGVVGSKGAPVSSTTITECIDGWYRCTMTYTQSGTIGRFRFGVSNSDSPNTYLGDTGMYADFDSPVLELGSFASTYIPTTTASVVRNADVLTYQFAGNMDATVGTAYAELFTLWSAATGATQIAMSANTDQLMNDGTGNASTVLRMNDGTTTVSKSGLTDMSTGSRKRAVSWGGSTMSLTGDGATPASGAFDGGIGSTAIGIGCRASASDNQWFGTIRNARIYQNQFTSAQLQALTS